MPDVTKDSLPVVDVLVIGAGMAGLTAASELTRAGGRVQLIDKGRGVGGRLASRRIDGAIFDHGAQFITARTPRFAALIEDCRRAGVVAEWYRTSEEGSPTQLRYRGHPGMSAIAKHLARDIEVMLDTRVVALRAAPDRWIAECENGRLCSARAVVMTPPVPQSLSILRAGGVELEPTLHAQLAGMQYERCLAVLATLAAPSHLPAAGGIAPQGGPIAWLADNQRKGISTEPAVTIHATHAFSLENWESDRQDSGRRLIAAAQDVLGGPVRTFQVHGWLYSKPITQGEPRCLVVRQAPMLVLAGDAFAGARVEGAALSGWAAAEALCQGAM
jgi:hypothetical protein